MQRILIVVYRGLLFISPLALMISRCANKGDSSVWSGGSGRTVSAFTLRFDIPSQPNKKVSAYIFKNGVLKGVFLSNNSTDAAGKAEVPAKKVDSNNCATSDLMEFEAGLYNIHYRIDTTNTGTFVYPSGCPGTAGFLSEAQNGSDQQQTLSSDGWITVITGLGALNQMQYNLSSTGVISLSRNTYCSILDGNTANPSIYTTSTMGYSQGSVAYNASGAATVTMNARLNSANNTHQYACWIDFNNSGSYDSGDKIASGTISSNPTTVSSWTLVP